MEQTIRLRGVRKEFSAADGVTVAVAGIDLDVAPGEIVALLGPNGAGKTTTLDMVLGFERPSAGSVQVFGLEPTDAVRAGRVSAVLQTGGLLRDLTVGETIELVGSTYASPPTAANVLARAGLTAIADRKVQSCSGGEQQRLRFALALLAEPDLLILDEPTAGMDVRARQEFWTAMQAEAAHGRTIVLATHYLQEAEDFAERIVLLADGRVIADGPTEEVRRRAAGRRVTAHIAAESVDWAVAEVQARGLADSVKNHDQRLHFTTLDSDELARLLLTELGGSDVEISAASLEEAFMALTQSATAQGALK